MNALSWIYSWILLSRIGRVFRERRLIHGYPFSRIGRVFRERRLIHGYSLSRIGRGLGRGKKYI
ncbi:hypothetical protein ACFORL_00165 [Legionella dresdenensis]|uniref:Uncharacterized protein n=1 Tax=Legionella dresdenensis TaxID=450200 RepID=A0ABV8CBR3_9GAMM